MLEKTITALFDLEGALIEAGFERTGLFIGSLGDLFSGELPLAWRAVEEVTE